jgi:hypothetical protein
MYELCRTKMDNRDISKRINSGFIPGQDCLITYQHYRLIRSYFKWIVPLN